MGRKLILHGTKLTDLDAPRLTSVDQLEAPGSLYLLDATHPVQPWSAGTLANNTTLPNLFSENLATLSTGATDPTLVVGGAFTSPSAKGRTERSSKGGLHVIVSQAVDLAQGDGVRVTMPAALGAYFAAHPDNDYYVSAWDRLTRVEINPTKASAALYVISRIGRANPELWYGDSGAFLASDLLTNTLGPRYGNAHAGAAHTTKTPAGAGPDWGAPDGGYHYSLGYGTSLSGRQRQFSSSVFYRFYVEDLTLSGRTYSEVSALDQQLYTAEVLTEGGRYYGDTFTAPSTIA